MYWTINTSLTEEEIINRLLSITDVNSKYLPDSDKVFWGTIDKKNFKIRLIQKYRAPFTPFAYGKILPAKTDNYATRVLLTVSPTTIQILFPIFLIIFSILMLNTHSSFGLASSSDYIFDIGLFLFIIFIGVAICRSEEKKIVKVITKHLSSG